MTTISSSLYSPSLLKAMANNNAKLQDLSEQLASGKVSSTYAGLGTGRDVALAMKAKLTQLDSYDGVGATVGTRIAVMNTVVDGLDTIASEIASFDSSASYSLSGGQTATQSQAGAYLNEAISYLNSDVDGRYLFSGASTDTEPVLSAEEILSDDGDKAGLKTVIYERGLADLGADGRGRLDVSEASGASFTVSEEESGDFGFKLSSASSSLTGGVVEGPTGDPATLTLGVDGTPSDGQTVTVTLTLPDGSTEDLTLTARTDDGAELQDGEFLIGATPEETTANLQAAFDSSLQTLADTSLTAASAVAAGNDFFTSDGEPARVTGFDGTYATDAERIAALQSATSLDTTGTADLTVAWYRGDDATSDPRDAATAKIADGVTVSYGAQANESAFANVIKSLAVLSATTFSASDANAEARYEALRERTVGALSSTETSSALQSVASDLAIANTSIEAAGDRHDAARALAEDALSGVVDADSDEVTVKILALQSSIEASYSVAATLKSLSLVNYL
ncbi:hypothetical protein [Methylopila sp. 73B]|uniref:hypothetical protein n=1 Tax=Methylopila sp. 73B TaxID=1120792 RepID=UPI000376EB67|nr:hypothetical protein [Methylopila sp. 73B]